MKKDIYIIKNSVNNKVYIGQSKNSAERWLSHVYNAIYEKKSNKKTQVIHRAMMKYGVDKFHYEIIEYQIENYDEREKYWINFYNSIAPNGYNVSVGGSGIGTGIDSINSVFKEKSKLLECISEISSSEKTFANIAKKFGCSQEVISAINLGYRYKMDEFIYPLRDTNSKYSYQTLKQIRYSLKYELDLSIKDISKKYMVDYSQVSNINQGKIYFVKNEKYPLRNKRISDLKDEVVENIINDIINSDLCLSDIAAKYNISRTRISGINQGKCYVKNNLSYPLRAETDKRSKSLKKFIDLSIIEEIHKLLQTDISIKEIANRYDLSKNTICNINSGKCKRYVLNKYKYPIRKLK